MRALYEGYAEALSGYLRMPLPPWIADQPHKDNWLTVARVRAQTEAANAPLEGESRSGDMPTPIIPLIDRHHDF